MLSYTVVGGRGLGQHSQPVMINGQLGWGVPDWMEDAGGWVADKAEVVWDKTTDGAAWIVDKACDISTSPYAVGLYAGVGAGAAAAVSGGMGAPAGAKAGLAAQAIVSGACMTIEAVKMQQALESAAKKSQQTPTVAAAANTKSAKSNTPILNLKVSQAAVTQAKTAAAPASMFPAGAIARYSRARNVYIIYVPVR